MLLYTSKGCTECRSTQEVRNPEPEARFPWLWSPKNPWMLVWVAPLMAGLFLLSASSLFGNEQMAMQLGLSVVTLRLGGLGLTIVWTVAFLMMPDRFMAHEKYIYAFLDEEGTLHIHHEPPSSIRHGEHDETGRTVFRLHVAWPANGSRIYGRGSKEWGIENCSGDLELEVVDSWGQSFGTKDFEEGQNPIIAQLLLVSGSGDEATEDTPPVASNVIPFRART